MFFNGQVKKGKSNAGLLRMVNEKPLPKLPYPLTAGTKWKNTTFLRPDW
jgi:hypothetical protein